MLGPLSPTEVICSDCMMMMLGDIGDAFTWLVPKATQNTIEIGPLTFAQYIKDVPTPVDTCLDGGIGYFRGWMHMYWHKYSKCCIGPWAFSL